MRLSISVILALLFVTATRAADGDNFVLWNWGTADDVAQDKVPRISPTDRIGDIGKDGEIAYRMVKGKIYQVSLIFPAFDIDESNRGAVKHSFYLTIKFKDVAKVRTWVYARKGGCGFYGAGVIGAFGGSGDNQWKEETLIVPRSMLRSTDNKTFLFKFAETKADVPVASMLLFSADTKLADAKSRIEAAHKLATAKRDAARAALLPKFKDLGLPDPGPAPEHTAAEKERGFRVFFPPIHRQLYANSQPAGKELTDSLTLAACPGQTLSLLCAIRGLKDLGAVQLEWQAPKIATDPNAAQKPPVVVDDDYYRTRWGVYNEQRIGSSWGTDYRMCVEQLVLGDSHAVGSERLEIAHVAVRVPENAKAGDYAGKIVLKAEKGGSAEFPVKLTVYPFKLERPAHSTHGQFYYVEYGDIDPFELEDQADHGMDTLVAGLGAPVAPGADGKRATDGSHAAFKELKRLDYRAPLIAGTGYMNKMLDDEKKKDAYTAVISETLKTAKDEGFDEMGFFSVDEPHSVDLQKLAKKACDWTSIVQGANTYITSNPNAVKVLDPVLNYVCYNLSYLNAATIGSVKPHQKLMFYCPSIGIDPERNRYVPGFYMYKVNAFSSQYFAYMEFAEDPFLDLDGPNRDWNTVFPSMDSPYHDPTLEWEAMRQGVYDYRFAYTLKAAADRARAKGKTAEADKAIAVLDEVLSVVDVDGKKAGGPAISIEANVGLKDMKLDPEKLKQNNALAGSAWYDESRRKIAQAIIDVSKE